MEKYGLLIQIWGLIKSSYVKEMLVREFGCDIVSQRKNQSEVVYDTT